MELTAAQAAKQHPSVDASAAHPCDRERQGSWGARFTTSNPSGFWAGLSVTRASEKRGFPASWIHNHPAAPSGVNVVARLWLWVRISLYPADKSGRLFVIMFGGWELGRTDVFVWHSPRPVFGEGDPTFPVCSSIEAANLRGRVQNEPDSGV